MKTSAYFLCLVKTINGTLTAKRADERGFLIAFKEIISVFRARPRPIKNITGECINASYTWFSGSDLWFNV